MFLYENNEPPEQKQHSNHRQNYEFLVRWKLEKFADQMHIAFKKRFFCLDASCAKSTIVSATPIKLIYFLIYINYSYL